MEQPTSDYDFNKLTIATPTSIQGNAYFTKISADGKPLYIETPRCLTKQGFVRSGKKLYCDLMFDNNSQEFILWMENLESKCQQLIFEKGNTWFETKLDLDDIQTAFSSPIRVFKSGNNYLIRANAKINSVTGLPYFKIFNEMEAALTIEDIGTSTMMTSVIEIQGIRFTSRTFQIEIELKQVMIIHGDELFNSCLLSKEKRQDNSIKPTQLSDETLTANALTANALTANALIANALTANSMSAPANILEEIKETFNDKTRDEYVPMDISEQADDNEIDSCYDADVLQEISVGDVFDNAESLTLKKPNQVYYDIYKAARKKAKTAKRDAIIAFLEAKNIKKAYMLEDIDDSDSDCNSDCNDDTAIM